MKKVIILENEDIENLKKGLVIECDGEKYALMDGVLNLVKTATSNKPTMRAVVGTRSAANVYKVKDDEYENIDATYKPGADNIYTAYISGGVVNPKTGKVYSKEDEGYKDHARKITYRATRLDENDINGKPTYAFELISDVQPLAERVLSLGAVTALNENMEKVF